MGRPCVGIRRRPSWKRKIQRDEGPCVLGTGSRSVLLELPVCPVPGEEKSRYRNGRRKG